MPSDKIVDKSYYVRCSTAVKELSYLSALS